VIEDLRGEFAIVTGAAQGLGAAIATAYAQAGMRLALMDVQDEKLNALAVQLGSDVLPIPVDLASAEATTAAVEKALASYGTPRVVVHNAAILRVMPFMELDFGEWSRVG
jgi:NAD(P)-dependent dehydrogenase (short-subunit alcohol dehydrogenase family)